MKLYEVTSRIAGIRSTFFFTNKTDAMAMFRVEKKGPYTEWVILHKCIVRTNLSATDWCNLLQADAPGQVCNLTPVDLIVDRELVSTYELEAKAA